MTSQLMKILVVEDNPGDADLVDERLNAAKDFHFEIAHAEHLSQGIERVAKEPFDLILLDLGLPDSQGIDTFIRMQKVCAKIPVVVLTGLDDDQTGLAAVSQGAQDYLIKNQVTTNVLLRTVRYAIERNRNAEELRQANRSLRMLSECNLMLVRTNNERELLEWICQIVVNIGGYRFIWVGYAEHDEMKTVRPVAQAGFEDGYLETVQNTWADTERGRGPTGTSIRTGKPVLYRDITEECSFGPWRVAAIKRGYASLLVLPLIGQSQMLGSLNIYSAEIDGFSPAQISILTELTDNLAFGVSSLRTQSERKRAEESLRESEETLGVISDSVLDAVILIDAEGRFRHWNPAAEKIFGYSREELIGHNLDEPLIPEKLREQYRHGRDEFHETGKGSTKGKTIEIEVVRKDGSHFLVELSVAGVILKGTWNAVCILRDISERKRVETNLKQAMDAAEVANQAKTEFLANMSHEIRTPMNGVIGLTEMVLDSDLSSEQRTYLNGVTTSAESLLKTIDAILDFSKIEAGQLELDHQRFNFREMFGMRIQTLIQRAHEKGLELNHEIRPDVPEVLIGDPARLWQIVLHLVENALKFTPKGSAFNDTPKGSISILVQMETLTQDAACLHFSVRDTGIGISPENQQVLFRRFVQADSTSTRKYGGAGLGLAISEQLVELMQGRIWIESEIGRGCTVHFTATFPLGTDAAVKRTSLSHSGFDKLRVLIVDGDPSTCRTLKETLEQWGMKPTEVASGNEALSALYAAADAREPFSLILLDTVIPDREGLALLEQIHEHPEIARPTILMLSSAGQEKDMAHAHELGATASLRKPIKQDELFDAMLPALGLGTKSATAPPPSVPAVPLGRRLRILLAEDNQVNQLLAVRTMEKAGHSVAVANNGEEALAALGRETFDLVLMDVQMPVMDGLQATARIRLQERDRGQHQHLPIVAMTAHALKGDREQCLEAGMDGYVAKPFRKSELFSAIEAAVNGQDTRSAKLAVTKMT